MALSPDGHRRQITECWAELQSYERLQRKVEERIQDLRELIRATANFLPDDERRAELMLLDMLKHPTNITEAVRAALFIALMNKAERLTPVQIKERAEQRGFNFSEYSNPLASIHTILRRLLKESDPPEVDFDEATGSYLMITKGGSLLSPEFTEKVKKQTWERIVGAALNEPIDPVKARALMDKASSQIIDDLLAFKKASRAVVE